DATTARLNAAALHWQHYLTKFVGLCATKCGATSATQVGQSRSGQSNRPALGDAPIGSYAGLRPRTCITTNVVPLVWGFEAASFAFSDCFIQFGFAHEPCVQDSVFERCRELNRQAQIRVARRECDDCGAHVDVFGTTFLQHRAGSPTRIEIAPTSAER